MSNKAPIPVHQQFTDEQKEEIRNLWEAGKTQKEIGEMFGVARRTIGKLFANMGLHRNHKEAQKSRLDPNFVQNVINLRNNGKTIEKIAEITNRSMSAVHRVCLKYSDDINIVANFDINKICNSYKDGESLSNVAYKHSITTYMVKKVLEEQSIEVRPPIMSGGSKIKIETIDLPDYADSKEWFEGAYLKYGMSSIAKFIGKSVGFVSGKLRKYKVKRLTISERNTEFDKDILVDLYNKLGSMSKVAGRLQCTIQTVKSALLSRGITPTPASEMFSGDGNPFYGKEHDEATKIKCIEIGTFHGKKFWEDNPEYIEVVTQKNKEIWSDLAKRQEQSKRIAQLRLEGKCNSKTGEIETRFGTLSFDSSYEAGIIEYCETACKLDSRLDRNLLLAGAMLHDIGKLEELEVTSRIKGSEKGQLVGHLTLGAIYLSDKLKSSSLDETLKNKLLHLIVSHHGRFEFGSPKEPMFPEAIVLYYADELSSKLTDIMEFIDENKEGTEDDFLYYGRKGSNIFLK